jgi:hypothetical protein
MNIFALVASFYFLVTLTRSTTLSENTRFDVERERFWMYIKLFAIIFIVWFVEISSFFMDSSNELYLISDVIKCFSSGILAFSLISMSQVRRLVFKRNSGVKDNDAENNST